MICEVSVPEKSEATSSQRAFIVFLRCVVAVLLVAACCCLMPGQALADDRQTVRVGVFSLGKFQGLDSQGQPQGYNAAYLDKIVQQTHWSVEYVSCENWVDATAKLENHEIDLLAPAQHIASLEQQFDYAAYPMGTEYAAVYALSSRGDLGYEDFKAMGSLKIGGAQNSTFTTKFVSEYSGEHGFEPQMSYYANTTDLFAALYAGEVDAVVTNIMFAEDDLKMLGMFSPLPVYYITWQGNTNVLTQLNEAMAAIKVNDPSFDNELMAKFFPQYAQSEFSATELEYLQQLGTVTVGYESASRPLSYQDEQGEFAGITRDLMDLIAQDCGITFAYVALPSEGTVSFQYLREHNIDVLCTVEHNEVNLSVESMTLSSPYLESNKVIVAPEGFTFDEDSNVRIALATASSTLEQVVQSQYPNATITTYNDVEECFEAVRSGKADLLIHNRYVADILLMRPRYSSLVVIPIDSLADRLCVATLNFGESGSSLNAQLQDERFLSAIDKSIAHITSTQVNGAIIANTSANEYKLTVGDFIDKYFYPLLTIILLVVAVILLLVYSWHQKARRAAELTIKNEQLRDAINQAQAASKAKSTFLARMSHEIRTPMNAIVGLTTLARAKVEDRAQVEDYLEKIDSSSKVLMGIVNDVLDVSAIESAKMRISAVPFNIEEVIVNVSSTYYTQCHSKGVDFASRVNGVTVERIEGDALRLNQILANLLSNACKFTPEGGRVLLNVTQRRLAGGVVHLEFAVSDTGEGMAPDMLERLFKPFEQESSTTASEHGGSGLGLSIVKNLVDMMHGSIAVESVKGEGTTFTVQLPFEVISVPSSQSEKLNPSDFRALVVDDDLEALEYASFVLDRIGVRHDEEADGRKVLTRLRRAHDEGDAYNLCLIDWRMPNIDGITLAQYIREEFPQGVLTIVMSAYDYAQADAGAGGKYVDAFMPKPLFQSALFDLLMELSSGVMGQPVFDVAQAAFNGDERFDFTGCRALVAEDHPLNARIVTGLLDMVHVKVDWAENGDKAVALFKASDPGTYDIVLMDIQMPHLNGYDATRAIRALDRPDAKTTPIYAMTANAFSSDVSEALAAGMDGHLSKPIDVSVLFTTLAKHCTCKDSDETE